MELTPTTNEKPSVLLCVDDTPIQTKLLEQLTGDFQVFTGLFAEDIFLKLHTHDFDIIVIASNFGGAEIEFNQVLSEATHLPIAQRRRQFIALVGPEMATNNDLQAFQHSVDLVFGISDLENFKPVLRRGVARHQEFYRTFNECLRMAGSN
jgi:hypothetical protein